MLFKKLWLFIFTATLVFAIQDKPLFEEYRTTLDTVHKNRATVPDSPKIEIGSSGIVIHRFSGTSSTIIAKATVLAKDGTKALLELTPYDVLEQNTFPKAELIPQNGDEVYLNYLYNRAIIVAPNYEKFRLITNYFNLIDWVHPDIIAANLAKKYLPNPDHEKFKELCNLNLTGLVVFSIGDKGYFTDCNSFKILRTISLQDDDKSEDVILPFYSRISENVKDSWFVWKGAKVSNYDLHYKALLGIE
ncbi:MAG: plasminogen-binding N-terminal domain-containing protein [Campylobacteraceae bacterium]